MEIQAQALDSAVLHADETGWRVDGRTHWLWRFTTADLTYYMIDRRRGGPALKRFFKKEFAGVLVTDFWSAYNAVVCAHKQKCLPHLLRDILWNTGHFDRRDAAQFHSRPLHRQRSHLDVVRLGGRLIELDRDANRRR